MIMMNRPRTTKTFLALCAVTFALSIPAVNAQEQATRAPSLLITSGPIPESLRRSVYSKPVQVREIRSSDILGSSYFNRSQTTPVTSRIRELSGDLGALQNDVAGLSSRLNSIQQENQERAAEYYASVATINTQLQSGTTPGNPRLVNRLNSAEQQLEQLGESVSQLNGISVQTAETASQAAFILEAARAAYNVSGAVEEDHVRLAELEDSINNTIILIDRVLNTVNDDITRSTTYLASERNNLRTLALGVSNGDLYGKSLANRPFSSAEAFSFASADTGAVATPAQSALSGPRPLAKIKFDRPDVEYEQPIFLAVNEALERYPNARFELVAVNPTSGNAAEVAIETTRARRNAERVLRSLTQMGLPLEQIDLSYSESATANSSEVHLFLK